MVSLCTARAVHFRGRSGGQYFALAGKCMLYIMKQTVELLYGQYLLLLSSSIANIVSFCK